MYPYNYDPITKAYIDGKMSIVRKTGKIAGSSLKRGSGIEMANYRRELREVRDSLHVYINL